MYPTPSKSTNIITNNSINHSPSATNAPLWKWLLTPKLRAHLHENRIIDGPPAASTSIQQNGQQLESQNPFLSREAALWKWRLKMRSLMMQGQSVAAGDAPKTNNNNNNINSPSTLYFSGGNHRSAASPNSSLSHNSFLASSSSSTKKKADLRFAAKTLASNLVSEIQARTINLMMLNLTPLTRAAVGASRFDMMCESRLALLESLHRVIAHNKNSSTNDEINGNGKSSSSSMLLSEECSKWKSCMASIMFSGDNNNKKNNNETTNESAKISKSNVTSSNSKLSAAAADVVVVPQRVFVQVGARIGQLVTLEETPDAQGIEEALMEFTKLAERDWATVSAQGGHKTLQKATSSFNQEKSGDNNNNNTPTSSLFLIPKTVQGLSFANWFNFVLLPIAVILFAPSSSSSSSSSSLSSTPSNSLVQSPEEQLIDHAIDFCSTLRKILFPTSTTFGETDFSRFTTTKQEVKEESKIVNHQHKIKSTSINKQTNSNKLLPNSGILIHSSGAYEQRLVSGGFHDEAEEATKINSVSSPPAVHERSRLSGRPATSPNYNSSQETSNNILQRPSTNHLSKTLPNVATNKNKNNQSNYYSPSASASPSVARKLPRAIQELVLRQQHESSSSFSASPSLDANNNDNTKMSMINVVRTQEFYQPFPRNTIRDAPSQQNGSNTEDKDRRAPIHLVTMDFSSARRAENIFGKKSLENGQIPETTSPVMPKSERQQLKDEQARQYFLRQEEIRDTAASSSSTMATSKKPTLGHMPKAELASTALTVSVNPSPTRKLSPRQQHAGEVEDDHGGRGSRVVKSPSPTKMRRTSMVHSTARQSLTSAHTISDFGGFGFFSTAEKQKHEREERELMKKQALSSTGRSFKNRVPRELNTMRLEVAKVIENPNSK